MKWMKYIVLLLIALIAIPQAMAQSVGDDDDKDPSIRPGIRRLHPERERAKAMKKLQEQMSRKAEPKDDPWDMTDEVWGTVDVPRVAVRDSNAVEGHRISPRQGGYYKLDGQDDSDLMPEQDNSPAGYGYRRMTWQDRPVTTTIDQLMTGFTVTEDGDYMSKYVARDGYSDEVYFTFNVAEGDTIPGPLRLCVRYCANDPLDFDLLMFTVDGFDYLFYPSEYQQGRLDDGRCWASSDDELEAPYKDLVYALAHGHMVAIKLLSERGTQQVKMLTDGQRADFAAALDLYRLMGGGF